MKAIPILLCMVAWISPTWAGEIYEKTLAGKSCHVTFNQQLMCKYKIGKDLEIEINGIGSQDTGITFMKSNFNGDYYATFGMQHLCVIIKSGEDPLEGGLAFISPKNGKVYKDWMTCKEGF